MTPKNQQSSKMKDKIPLVDAKLAKVNGIGKHKEPLKKDLIVKINNLEKKIEDLEHKNETLEATNSKNLETIKCLQTKIENIPKNNNACSRETQTERGIELKCTECNFQATSSSELSWHLCKTHGWSEEHDLDMSTGPRYCDKCDFEAADGYEMDGHMWSEHDEEDEGSFECQYCDEKFAVLKDLMVHKKTQHEEKVSSCWYFLNKSCIYGEDKCWFSHERYESHEDENFNICRICGERFSTLTMYMKHMKSEHLEIVKECKNFLEGRCSYNKNCWFKHEESHKKEKNEEVNNENNKEMMNKLFEMVEKYTKRIVNVEDLVKKTITDTCKNQ